MLFFETWKPKGRGYVQSTIPHAAIGKTAISFNCAALEECVKSSRRCTILPDPKTPAIGFCFHDGDLEGDFTISKTKNRDGKITGGSIKARSLYADYPVFLSTVVPLGLKRFQINAVAIEDVPDNFKGSKLFVIKIQK